MADDWSQKEHVRRTVSLSKPDPLATLDPQHPRRGRNGSFHPLTPSPKMIAPCGRFAVSKQAKRAAQKKPYLGTFPLCDP